MRSLYLSLLMGMLIANAACGGGAAGSDPAPQAGPLSGNWEISLARHVNPDPPLIYTGFLQQSGNAVTGSLIVVPNNSVPGCPGVGTITGAVNGQNVTLTINESGEDVSLTGTMPSSGTPMGGQFSNLAGGCTDFPNTGTWSAIQIAPVSGNFHGTMMSTMGNGTFDVTGTLTQGANTGSSNAPLSGTITDTGSPRLCYDLSSATITGLISGTTVTLAFYGPDGSQIAQVPFGGTATVDTDGKSLTGTYVFPGSTVASSACTAGDQGNIQITFP